MKSYLVLNEKGEPQIESDLEVWLRWFEQARRDIARTLVTPAIVVLTMFSGVDEPAAPGDPPRLFETRVFGGTLDGEELKHTTREEAVAAHSRLVNWCRAGATPSLGLDE